MLLLWNNCRRVLWENSLTCMLRLALEIRPMLSTNKEELFLLNCIQDPDKFENRCFSPPRSVIKSPSLQSKYPWIWKICVCPLGSLRKFFHFWFWGKGGRGAWCLCSAECEWSYNTHSYITPPLLMACGCFRVAWPLAAACVITCWLGGD